MNGYLASTSGATEADGIFTVTITNTPPGSYDQSTSVNLSKLWVESDGVTASTDHAESIEFCITQKKYVASVKKGNTTKQIWPVMVMLINQNNTSSSRMLFVPDGEKFIATASSLSPRANPELHEWQRGRTPLRKDTSASSSSDRWNESTWCVP